MKFTDGFWQTRPGVRLEHAAEAFDIEERSDHPDGAALVVSGPTTPIVRRGDTLNRPLLTVTVSSPAEGVARVRIENHIGRRADAGFDLIGTEPGSASIAGGERSATLSTGSLSVEIQRGAPWNIDFRSDGRRLTGLGKDSIGRATLRPDAEVDRGPSGNAREGTPRPTIDRMMLAQLDLGVGEVVYGLGERFGPLVKNGQSIDIWNADGGTSSEQAYKNVPFYLSNRGYGVLVNDAGLVSFEIGSEAVERVQFSTPGESLEFLVFDGPTPKDVMSRYTALLGRPAAPPAWSYGVWLSTSFTTDYDEETVSSFVDGMQERGLPLSVVHFDCFWMREFNWCDFEWDPRVFPDPQGMIERLQARELRVSVWINPYIAQRSPLFEEGARAGFLLRRPDGSVHQGDLWQAGMALVDFTNPGAVEWYRSKLRTLMADGVAAFKTDFGERVPLDVVWHDGSDPTRMHNRYAQLYNQTVFDLLREVRGEGEAVVFARSATAGGQRMPVHWGGDSTSTFASMAETLRGGLSLAASGFGFWSHDIGGFEGTPDAGVFKRWTAFGLLSSHSRFHGSSSYRVPWAFDEEAVDVTRHFARLKNSLMPYLFAAGAEAHERGIPVMRPMALEFPDDPSVVHLDRQYMLGPDLLVAPVFSADGEVEFYLPHGRWTRFDDDEVVEGGRWLRETHGFLSLPLYVREGAVIPVGARDDRPDYDYRAGLRWELYAGAAGSRRLSITTPDGRRTEHLVEHGGQRNSVSAT